METILVDIHHDSSKKSVINMDHLQTISPVQTANVVGDLELLVHQLGDN